MNKKIDLRLQYIYQAIIEEGEIGKKRIKKYLESLKIVASDKTINNDIQVLINKKIILKNGNGRSTEYIAVDRFKELSFENKSIDSDDLFSLEMALISLSQLKFLSLGVDIENIINKLEKEVGFKKRQNQNFISFQNNFLKINTTIFQQLIEATSNKKVLEISYQNFKSKQKTNFIFHPYFLKQFNNRWFLIGLTESYNDLTILGVERIVTAKIKFQLNFDNSKYISPQEYSKNLFGVSRNENKIDKIVIEIDKSRVPYFISKPIIEPFKFKELGNGNYLIYFNCAINNELIGEMLHYGKDIIVKKPKILKDLIYNNLISAISKY